ncbi:toast rack family protein [Clostridium ganghwense]|uniref:Toast rack family protein n=1 Tax=Clostridium ganghwense TaxID=312089 RepID=A0ABT4CV02_9CLOT|nr:toast rack family protein [Clostridium ganghwense]MCY6372738.1 toast rack family protein [Clostridium ganghwense]
MKIKIKLLVILGIVGVAAALNGCGVSINVNNKNKATKTETKVVELQGAKKVKVDIDMGVGELQIKDGQDKLMNGEFIYTIPEWKPEVEYNVNGEEGKLKVIQPSSMDGSAGKNEYRWNLGFNKEIPMDMDINLGVGESNIDLSKLNINNLDMKTGVGEVNLNIAGDYKNDMNVNIEAGIGKCEIYLPKNIGVKVEVEKGLGDIKANGFKIDNDNYINDSYGKTKNNINVCVKAGIGEVELKLK